MCSGRAPLPDQLETLRVRIRDSAKIYPYNERWFVAKEGTDKREECRSSAAPS
jgi:hypothetical protein